MPSTRPSSLFALLLLRLIHSALTAAELQPCKFEVFYTINCTMPNGFPTDMLVVGGKDSGGLDAPAADAKKDLAWASTCQFSDNEVWKRQGGFYMSWRLASPKCLENGGDKYDVAVAWVKDPKCSDSTYRPPDDAPLVDLRNLAVYQKCHENINMPTGGGFVGMQLRYKIRKKTQGADKSVSIYTDAYASAQKSKNPTTPTNGPPIFTDAYASAQKSKKPVTTTTTTNAQPGPSTAGTVIRQSASNVPAGTVVATNPDPAPPKPPPPPPQSPVPPPASNPPASGPVPPVSNTAVPSQQSLAQQPQPPAQQSPAQQPPPQQPPSQQAPAQQSSAQQPPAQQPPAQQVPAQQPPTQQQQQPQQPAPPIPPQQQPPPPAPLQNPPAPPPPGAQPLPPATNPQTPPSQPQQQQPPQPGNSNPNPNPAPNSAPSPSICQTQQYTIKPGDTGYALALANNIPLAQLFALNPGVVWEKLMVGQVLVLPAPASGVCP